MTQAEMPSVTRFVFSGTPLIRDPYRSIQANAIDPVQSVSESGTDAVFEWLRAIISKTGDVVVAEAMPGSRRPDEITNLLGDALAYVENLEDKGVREQGRQLLEQLRGRLPATANEHPRFIPTSLDDGSLLIEWVLPSRRLGFLLHPKPGSSGWFFVSSPESGNIMVSGALRDAPMDRLIEWALTNHL